MTALMAMHEGETLPNCVFHVGQRVNSDLGYGYIRELESLDPTDISIIAWVALDYSTHWVMLNTDDLEVA